MCSWVSSYGSSWASNSYSLDGVPSEVPFGHLDLTGDDSFFGDCCICDSRLYIRTGGDDEQGYLTCYDLNANRIDWRKNYKFGHTSSMTIENGKLAVGYLIVDASNGELIFDIRDYFNGFEDDIYGLTYFSNNLLCKSTDFYTPDSGYVFCDIDVKDADNVNIPGGSIKFIRSDILVCLDGNRVYSYGLDTRDVLWEQIVETDDPIIHLFDDKVVILDGQLIREVSLRSGSILHEVCLADNISELSTNQMKNLNDFSSCICEDSLVIYNGLGMDSWIMVIERSSYEVLYIKTDHDIGVVRICGDLIFYCNGQNKIQALWKDSGKLAWTSRENITARSINSAGNFLVVGVIHGGFTIFKVS